VSTASVSHTTAPTVTTPAIKFSTVKADGIDIRCLEAGSGKPLVYLHGSSGLRLSATHRALASNHRLIALELPGFGKTAAKTAHGTARGIATTMAAALHAMGVEECDLMGHSLGANVALWLAIDHPTLARSLILVAPTAIRPEDSGIGGARPFVVTAHKPEHLWIDESSATSNPSMRELAQKLSGPQRDAELEKAMAGIAIPVLALFGTRCMVVSTDAAREYNRGIPKCFTTMVYDAGHEIDLDRPDAVTSVVGNFLEHGETFIVNRDSAMINP